jgi:hypothetical protein
MRSVQRRLLYWFFRQNWNIAVTHHPIPAVAGLDGARKQSEALGDLVWMPESRGTFSADPFIMPSDDNPDEFTILYEQFDWGRGRGRIDRVSYNKALRSFGQNRTAFESPYHLSYPYVLRHNGSYVCVPEQSEAGEVSIYRIGPDGFAGEKHTVLPATGLVDSTVVAWDGLYWIFSTIAGEHDNSHLHIFSAPELFGPWTPHEKNPVKVDRANARPAGQPFVHRGALFRPAQDCTSHYGSGIIINEIAVLTKSEFAESPVAEIRPDPSSPYNFGLHTISCAGETTVLDGARLESKLHPGLDRFSNYFH